MGRCTACRKLQSLAGRNCVAPSSSSGLFRLMARDAITNVEDWNISSRRARSPSRLRISCLYWLSLRVCLLDGAAEQVDRDAASMSIFSYSPWIVMERNSDSLVVLGLRERLFEQRLSRPALPRTKILLVSSKSLSSLAAGPGSTTVLFRQ